MALVFSGTQELHTDKIETFGAANRRVFFHTLVLVVDDLTGIQSKLWLYFGTTIIEKPPTTLDPVTVFPSVNFPSAFDDLGADANDALYTIGLQAGLKLAGLVV